MAAVIDLPQLDDLPRTGLWVDHEAWFGHLTDEEIREGLRLGTAIDVDDDLDTGEPRLRGLLTPARSSAQNAALARARLLRESLLDHGILRVSIELQTGRPGTPNGAWWDDRFVSEMSHHTVSRPSQGLTPCLALVKRGRPDVPGPLCNGYMGYDLVYRIICMGWANHPGAGGPLVVAGSRIPRDGARPYAWGTEFEGGLEPWTDAMHEAMARSDAAILDWIGEPLEAHIEHSSWTDRKIDRRGYTAASGRARIRPFMGGGALPDTGNPEDEFDMDKATFEQWSRNAFASAIETNPTVRRELKGLMGEVIDERAGGAVMGYVNPSYGEQDVYARIRAIGAGLQALAAAKGVEVDLSAIEELTGSVEELTRKLGATSELLQEVADGQITPDRVADELAQRLAA